MRTSIVVSVVVAMAMVGCQPAPRDPQVVAKLDALEQNQDLLRAMPIKGAIPSDPEDLAWNSARQYSVTLVPQISIAPRAPKTDSTELLVQILFNRREVGFLLSWPDATKDDWEAATEQFRDAVALGFPISQTPGESLPHIAMGNTDRPVNIWHWKASWEADLNGRRGVAQANPGMVPSDAPEEWQVRTGEQAGSLYSKTQKGSVENLLAEGFGTLTTAEKGAPEGKGVWKDGYWTVVLRRKRQAGKYVDFSKGLVPITFSVWDGSRSQRNGIKGLSRWRFVEFPDGLIPAETTAAIIPGAIPGADAANGKELAKKMRCYSCHMLPDSPPQQFPGPDLRLAGGMHRADFLIESIVLPNEVVMRAPGYFTPDTGLSTMPSYQEILEEGDAEDMAEYLRILQ